MSETIRKVCACLCFLGAAAIIAPGCGNDSGSKNNGEEDCAEGETSASVDGEVGCHPTCDDGVCEAGFMCQSGICIADSTTGTNNDDNSTSNNSTPNNSTPNNSTPNNSTPNNSTPNNSTPNNSTPNNSTPNNSTPNNNTVDPTTQANCDKVADLFYGSCWDTCTLNAEVTTALANLETEFAASCATDATADAAYKAQVDEFAATGTCDDLKSDRCGYYGFAQECGCALPTNVGAACTDDAGCMGGDLGAACNTQLTDGYCVAGPCPGSSEAGTHGLAYGLPEVCGAGNICINYIDQMSGVGSGTCLAGCDNCDRAGYACHFMNFNAGEAEGEVIAVRGCLPACAANADCGEGSRCNAGVCEFECDAAAGPNGEPSAAALCAQSGGTCTAGDGGLEYCVY